MTKPDHLARRPTRRAPATARAPRTPAPRPGAPRPRAPRPPGRRPAAAGPGSHDRILDAALQEFADRGFAGARVDRIAASAGLNKAMLYYHFGSKARLYRTAIQRVLDRLARSLEDVAASDIPPPARLDRYIETIVSLGLAEPRFAPVMLRELAEGATHIDRDTVAHVLRVASTMAVIVEAGRRTGEFRDVNPLLAYLSTVWPIMVYLAAGHMRDTIRRHSDVDTSTLEPASFVRHMQDVSRRSLLATIPALPPVPAARPGEHAS